MPRGWQGSVFLPMASLREVLVAGLSQFDSNFQSRSTTSLWRPAEIFTVITPFPLTIRLREEGMRGRPGDRRPASSLRIVTSPEATPHLRSFILAIARRLPRPPWQMTEVQRKNLLRTWSTFFILSALPAALGAVSFFVLPSSFLSLLLNLLLVAAGLVTFIVSTIVTRPSVVSRIQRRKWGHWIEAPEIAALGWKAG